MWTRLSAVAAAALMVTVGSTVTTTSVQAQSAGCDVNYAIASEWPGGFTANVTITNLGATLSTWSLSWSFPAGQQITQVWNANASQSGSQVTARDAGYNGNIARNGTVSFGFNGSWSGSNPAPSAFSLNGTACTGAPVDPTSGPTQGPSPTAGPSPSPGNPTWGTALPPAGAQLSQAYELIIGNSSSGYNPKSGECSREIHARYWTYGPDGKVYPTWHPPRDPSGCRFGHEHGDDPRNSNLFNTAGWPAFGYVSEVMADSLPAGSHRHEDHVGHKVVAVNNQNIIQGDNGSSFLPPSGSTIAVCDMLVKIHQGTHSPDAFSNHLHELISAIRCTRNGQVSEARFSLMIPFGVGGGFSPSECPGFGGPRINVGPAVPANGPNDTTSLGRLIAESGCIAAIRRGDTHFDPALGQVVPFNVSDMDDFWFSSFGVSGPGLSFNLAPLFYVVDSSRYYDPSQPNNNGRIVDLCYDQSLLGGFNCDTVRQYNERIAWDDPRSPFRGALREMRPGMFSLQNTGPTTVYTDVYGRNVSATPFEGAIEQYFSGNTSGNLYLRGALRDWAANSADQIRAPN